MWISSATSETTRSWTRSPLANDSVLMPPCGWPFTTRIVLTAGSAGVVAVDVDVDVEGALAAGAEVDELDEPAGAVEPSSPPGRRSRNATISATTPAAR